MRNFLLVLTFILSVLGFGQTASAQVCEGTANLDYGEYVWSVGDGQWKLLKDPRVYCDVTCPDSSELVLLAGDAHYCSDDGQTVEQFNPNGSISNIAGILSLNKKILGMMPHPERYTDMKQKDMIMKQMIGSML